MSRFVHYFLPWPIIAYVLAAAFYPVEWHIEIRAIDIADAREGEPVIMRVDRTIYGDWHGKYEVIIRRIGHGIYCTTGEIPVQYEKQTKLPNPMTLTWWAYGGECTLRLRHLKPGDYSVRTCHTVVRPLRILPSARKCWLPAATFTVEPRA